MPVPMIELPQMPLPPCYQTPAGYSDEFFVYTFEGSSDPGGAGLVNGRNYKGLSVNIFDGFDFILRRVVGLPNLVAEDTGKWQLRDMSNQYIQSDPQIVNFGGNKNLQNWLILPELYYQHASSIVFDLYDVDLETSGVPNGGAVISWAQLAFVGVRRTPYPQPPCPYKYRLKPFIYRKTFAISTVQQPTPTVYNPFIRQFQLIEDYDFELHAISTGGSNGYRFQLYNAGRTAVSDQPLMASYLTEPTPWGRPIQDSLGAFNGAVNPPLIYPARSQIQFDVVSMLQASQVPATFNIDFIGKQRIPI